MSEQQDADSVQEHLAPEGHASWPDYWMAQGMPWRTEPEIEEERQQYLSGRRGVAADIEKGLYPFKGVEPKLTRGDIEWLLATHESAGMKGPVDYTDERQREREGIDLRGSDLCEIDLSGLPLGRLRAGLSLRDFEQFAVADGVVLDQGDPLGSIIEVYYLRKRAVDASKVDARRCNLNDAHLGEAILTAADLRYTQFCNAHLESVVLWFASLEHGDFARTFLTGASLHLANLEGANLVGTRLVPDKRESIPNSRRARKSNQRLFPPADLRGTLFDRLSTLFRTEFGSPKVGSAMLADINWNGADVTVVDWSHVQILGDEKQARERKTSNGARKSKTLRRTEFLGAVRANRQIATVLRSQGLSEDADRFAYRAQVLQRIVLRRQRKLLRYAGSFALGLISGYGYKPIRSLITYLLVVGAFALTYYLLGGNVNPPLDPLGAVVFSITSFHGRGFAPGEDVVITNPLTVLAAIEAVIGLLIEITFIATFTQRFFAR